ncbi:hypothetical protein [Clostridium botulinum]|uniref:hypothetical protein n=1 Tax=Clostridium botulinum TaxID=1491 RepID=UPI003DA46C3C
MAKKKDSSIGTCALCKKVEVELRESHLIPKLVYRRIQSSPNVRFRNLYQLKEIYQDGEKKPMLCHDCEQFFNRFETLYTNKILDPYLNNDEPKEISQDVFNNFINSMAWRIVYDDLYNLQAFDGMGHRSIFEGIERDLWRHLNSVRSGKTEIGSIENFINHVFTIDDFNYNLPVKELFASTTFGYCIVNDYGNYYIIACFLGLVFVTEYKPSIYIGAGGFISNMINSFKRSNIKARVKEELLEYAYITAQQAMKNEELLNAGLREQIMKRYNKTK